MKRIALNFVIALITFLIGVYAVTRADKEVIHLQSDAQPQSHQPFKTLRRCPRRPGGGAILLGAVVYSKQLKDWCKGPQFSTIESVSPAEINK